MVNPPISEEELKGLGKSDGFVKLIALTQIIWSVVQALFRAIHHYHTTAIEVMTVAFVFCSIFTYGFCWQVPQNVEYPVFIEIQNTLIARKEVARDENPDESNKTQERAALSDSTP